MFIVFIYNAIQFNDAIDVMFQCGDMWRRWLVNSSSIGNSKDDKLKTNIAFVHGFVGINDLLQC